MADEHSSGAFSGSLHIATVIFDGFEPLDAVGPLELLGQLANVCTPELANDELALHFSYVAAQAGPVTSKVASMTWLADHSFDSFAAAHASGAHGARLWLLVPGGIGTRTAAADSQLLAFLAHWAGKADIVMSVCTGAALLAAAGVLDGLRATTNKMAWAWATSQGPSTLWQRRARWVRDGKVVTSSGVSAGMDMALYVIDWQLGPATAQQVATRAEYVRSSDPDCDPFCEEGQLT